MTLTDTLAFYDMAKIATAKSVIVQGPGVNVIKPFLTGKECLACYV
jgi:hypothetical protein